MFFNTYKDFRDIFRGLENVKKINLSTVDELRRVAVDVHKNLLKRCFLQTIYIVGHLSVADVMTALWQ